MKKQSLIITLGLLVVFVGIVTLGPSFGPSLLNMRSSALDTPSFPTMTEAQLRAYIAEQDALIATANTKLALYQSNKKAAEKALAKLINPQVCANGKTNFPACDNTICQTGYRLENNFCILDSECAVVYIYREVSEETTIPNVGTTPTTNIEDLIDIDFTFTNPDLESKFLSMGDNIRLTYDGPTSTVKGQFDLSGKTYTCKPLVLKKETDTFTGNTCNAEKGDILTCQTGVLYSMSYECDNKSYSYILKQCSTPPKPPVVPLSATCESKPSSPTRSRVVTWTALPKGGNGEYTYSWILSPDYIGEPSTPNTYIKSTAMKTYTRTGTKTATLNVKSGTESVTTRCKVEIQ